MFDKHSIGCEIEYYTGENYYKTEHWRMGFKPLLSNDPILSGYYEDEFDYEKGMIANIVYAYAVIPEIFTIFSQYDSFYNQDQSKIYSGLGLGLGAAFKSFYDSEITMQAGIGLNADKRDPFGYGFEIQVIKTWLE